MKTDSNYGHIENGELVLAPSQYGYCVTPNAAIHAAHGNLPIIRTQERVASAGHELVRVGWEERDGAIFAVWEERELSPTVHVFTPLALIRVLTLVGQWETVRAALKAAGEEVYEQFIAAIEIKEDDPAFAPFLSWARAQFGGEMLTRMMDAASQGTEYVNTLTAADIAGGAQ